MQSSSSLHYSQGNTSALDPTVLSLLRNNTTAASGASRSPSSSPTDTSYQQGAMGPKGNWNHPTMEPATETHWRDMEDDLLRMVDGHDQVPTDQRPKMSNDPERDSLLALLGGLKLNSSLHPRAGFSGHSSGLNTPPSRTGSAGAYRNGEKPLVPPGLGFLPTSTPSPVHGAHPANHSCQLCPHDGQNVVPASRFTPTGTPVHMSGPALAQNRFRSASNGSGTPPFAHAYGPPPPQQHVPLYQRVGQQRPSFHRPTASVDRFAMPHAVNQFQYQQQQQQQHRSGPSTPLRTSPLLASSELAIEQQVPPSRYVVLTNLPSHVPFQSLKLFEDGNVVRAVYAGTLRTQGTVIAAYFDIRYAVLAVKDLRQRFVEGRQIEAKFCPVSTLERVSQLEPSFVSSNEGIVLISNLPSNADLEQMQVRMASFGHVKNVRVLDVPSGSTIVVTEYFDIRDAAHACDQLHNTPFQGNHIHVRIKDAHDHQTTALLQMIPDSPPTNGRPMVARSQTTPAMPSSGALPSAMGATDDSNRDEAVSRVKEALFLRREQQRLIEADRTALSKHQVPQGNEIVLWKVAQAMDKRTTLMIRNIPNKFTQQMLLDLVNSTHHGEFDFFYLRMDFRNHCNVGYAFINFIDPQSIITFAHKHVGRKWCASLLEKLQLPSVNDEAAFRSKFGSDKVCRLSYANIQGKTALMEKFRNSSVMEKDSTYRPKIFFSDGPLRGQEEPFPGPTHGGRRTNPNNNEAQDSNHWAGAKSAMTALGLLEAEEELERMEFSGF